MAEHKIFVSASPFWLKKKARELDFRVQELETLDMEVVRGQVRDFEAFSGNHDVLIVDEHILKYKRVSILLKVLENPKVRGSIWFCGAELWDYPFTIRSRCFVMGMDESQMTEEVVIQFLEKKNAISYLEDVQCLRGYELSTSLRMAELKDEFMDLLRNVEVATPKDFAVLFPQLTNIEYISFFIRLFLEWRARNPLFSAKELGCCEFLRTNEFIQRFRQEEDWEHLFLFILCYKLVGS